VPLYRVVRHVVDVQDTALDPVFLVGEQILGDAIDPQDIADLILFKLYRVQGGNLPSDVEPGDDLLKLRVGLLFQELPLKGVVLKILVFFFHL